MRGSHYYHEANVVSNIRETIRVNTLVLRLNEGLNMAPGQFLMVWRPGEGEIPVTPSLIQGETLSLTIEKVGFTSNRLASLKPGEKVFLRGPLGNGFNLSLPGRYLLIGGGTGAASLTPAYLSLASKGVEALFLVGARDTENLVYISRLKELGVRFKVATDDGSEGFKGTLPEFFEELVSKDRFENVLTIGPEKMMVKIAEKCVDYGISCQVSLVRIVKCGLGLCGSCVLDPFGLRVCVDGPVFYGEKILGSDFGRFMRDEAGRRIEIVQ
ncbi:MAG: dihydroorotate dehydrogenase electron transfer subunit [Thaumarchaeota archaeon]|nr:dihydroorotate dehydrogenase electron transfer subunit [Nitrososphaerota archaeon]